MKGECISLKALKSCLITLVVIIGIIAISIFLFFSRFSYNSPVNVAGREYRKNIEAYQKNEIETMEDVYERLEMLDSHFDSPTFSKMQGGDKEEVTLSDIEILFGKPDKIFKNIEMRYFDTVYQYYYENLTLNFHENMGNINEYVIEDYSSTFYTSESLDQLFIDALLNQQAPFDQANDDFDPITLEQASNILMNDFPTRELKQSGWSSWSYSPIKIQYFDDGSGLYAPEEYLLLRYKKEHEDIVLHLMERRYSETYKRLDSIEDAEQKLEAYNTFKEIIDAKKINENNERFTVGDLSNEFGDIARFDYNFQNGLLKIVWLSNNENKREFITEIPIENISDVEDFNDLEVNNLESKRIYSSDRPYRTDEFISSKQI